MRSGSFVFSVFYLLAAAFLLAFVPSPGSELSSLKKNKEALVGFYNVENLFDTLDDPQKADEDFTPSGEMRWNSEKYVQKLDRLALVISSMHEGKGPDILGLCEIENRLVLEDLVRHPLLKKKKYRIVHVESPDQRGIDVALLLSPAYRLKAYLTDKVLLPDTAEKTRDILWADILSSSGETLWVGVCHFPSRRGGEEISVPKRVCAARALLHRTDSLHAASEKWLIMGDFNDEPGDSSLYSVLNAREAEAAADRVNMMIPLKEAGLGSYKYRDEWNMLDQFIISRTLYSSVSGWRYAEGSVGIYSPDFIKETEGRYTGSPWRSYAGKKYLGGYSDHFPVILKLKF
jgi:endonuclease/exonuclease/phosphatase family metal-dependent hydrolase